MIIVTVQDVKSSYLGITLDKTDATAIRGFEYLCRNTQSEVGRNPNDFRLWKIGDFDMDTGKIITLDVPVLLCDGVDVRKDV